MQPTPKNTHIIHTLSNTTTYPMDYKVGETLFEVPKHLKENNQELRDIYNHVYIGIIMGVTLQNMEIFNSNPQNTEIKECGRV